MTDYFDTPIAYNPDLNELLAGAVFQVFAVDDLSFSTPLAVFEAASGASLSTLTSSNIGVLPQFRVAGNPTEIVLKSGPFATRVTSVFGRKGEPGISAYQAAVAGGFEGSEAEFNLMLAGVSATVVGGHVNDEGHLILELSSGETVDAGIVKGATGTGFADPATLPDGSVPIVASGAWGYGPGGSGGSGGPSPVLVYKWTGLAWPTVPSAAPVGAVLRIFDANGYTNATPYTGPTWAGVTDWFILPEA
jgi:hypothetical protein